MVAIGCWIYNGLIANNSGSRISPYWQVPRSYSLKKVVLLTRKCNCDHCVKPLITEIHRVRHGKVLFKKDR